MGSLAFLFVLENYIFIGTIYLVIAVIGGAVLQDFSLFVSVIIVGIICSIAIVTVGHLLPAMLLGTALWSWGPLAAFIINVGIFLISMKLLFFSN